MDPQATLELFLAACEEDDRDGAIEALENMLGWIKKGGFLPYDPRREEETTD
jgi:hypothetical protein